MNEILPEIILYGGTYSDIARDLNLCPSTGYIKKSKQVRMIKT